MAKRQFFRTKERYQAQQASDKIKHKIKRATKRILADLEVNEFELKRKSESRTRLQQEQARRETEEYFNSPEGKEKLAAIERADELSRMLAAKIR